jgi:hypothetical protein
MQYRPDNYARRHDLARLTRMEAKRAPPLLAVHNTGSCGTCWARRKANTLIPTVLDRTTDCDQLTDVILHTTKSGTSTRLASREKLETNIYNINIHIDSETVCIRDKTHVEEGDRNRVYTSTGLVSREKPHSYTCYRDEYEWDQSRHPNNASTRDAHPKGSQNAGVCSRHEGH